MKQLLFVLIVSSVTAFAQTPGCTPPPAHVTSWWTFDETSGTTAHDVAGATKNDGAHAGAVALTAGKVAGAACYDGIGASTVVPNGAEIDFRTHCEVDIGGAMTIDFWVKTDLSTGTYSILDKRESDGFSYLKGYHVYVSYGRLGFQAANGVGPLYCGGAGAVCTNYTSPFFIADGEWHFVAVTLETACFFSNLTFYVDGLASTIPISLHDLSNSADLYVARRMPNLGGEYFRGCIDELEISTPSGLTQSELDAIYAAGSAGKCKPVVGQCPIMTACIGACSPTVSTQMTIADDESPAGCAKSPCKLQVKFTGGCCFAGTVDLTFQVGNLSSTKTITFDPDNDPQIYTLPWDLKPYDVVHVSAMQTTGGTFCGCKTAGDFNFDLTLVH